MSDTRKFVNIHTDVLIEWIYNNGSISEDYSVWTNLKNQKRSFLSKSNYNNIDYTLFNVDPVLKKYTKLDPSKFNFIKLQDYFTSPVQYDKVNIYFPFDYDFDDYIGFLMGIYCYDFENKNIYYLSNYFYDKTDTNIEKLMQIGNPFKYGEREWGKYLTISIPSVEDVSNQRTITDKYNKPIDNSINYNLTNGDGLGLSTPIFIDFSFITTRETVLGVTYYYLGDTYDTSISKVPEYQSLGVTIKESDEWDFFEIYGFYNDSNENLDNFVRDLEEKGRKINIEYIVTLYEENIRSGFPTKFIVTEDFSQKIEYRPVFKYSNTTAAIDVEMQIKDLVDNSTIIRRTSIGLTRNLFKYGKKLSRLNIDTINKPKIYNYRSDNAVGSNTNLSPVNTYGITKVPYPLLINNYKILLNSSKSQISSSDYKSIGTLTILLTPFDNIIRFKIARQVKEDSTPEPYDMSEVLSNAKLTLIFKSPTEMIERDIFHESDQNNIKEGIVVYKIQESDMSIIKGIYDNDNDNFYLTVVSNSNRTLLYSGKFKIYEDVKFIDENVTISLETGKSKKKPGTGVTPVPTNIDKKRFYFDDTINRNDPFQEKNLPERPSYHQSDLDYYKNVIIYMKKGVTEKEKSIVKDQLKSLGLSVYYEYDETLVIERVHVSKIKSINDIGNIDNVITLKLNFGWGDVNPPTQRLPQNPTDAL